MEAADRPQLPGTNATPSSEASQSTPDEAAYCAKLAGGVTVEVLAISSDPSNPRAWWRPNGAPLDEPLADPLPFRYRPPADEQLRTIFVRVSRVARGDTLKWLPNYDHGQYSSEEVTKEGRRLPDLRACLASVRRGRESCTVRINLATGPWKTEASDRGGGGHSVVIDGLKYYFGKARPFQGGTALAVAHNIVGRDNRIVAVDLKGKEHAPTGTSGGGHEILSLLDAEFSQPRDQIREFRVQSRPFEQKVITDIALEPRPARASQAAASHGEHANAYRATSVESDRDSDGDGLSDYQEIHKYLSDPNKFSTAGDGVSDGDWQRRREFTYTIRSMVKVMRPVNLQCLNDDYQDVKVLFDLDKLVELEVVHYPLNTNADAIRSNPLWQRAAGNMKAYLAPGVTTNWDGAMKRDLLAAIRADGIDPDQLADSELVSRAAAWLLAHSKFVNMFCTHYVYYPDGRPTILPGLEAKFESDKGDRSWTVSEQLERELYGRSMFASRTHGTCTSTAVYLTTCLRALGIPTRMVLGIPLVDANDAAQMDMVRGAIHHHRVRQVLLLGLSSAQGYANHTFSEVFVGGRWVRLNYAKLGQNSLDAATMGLLTHVNTFNDLSEVPLAETWGKRYALGERDDVFRYGNPYRCVELSDHFGKFARLDNSQAREHRSITISRAYWADDPGAPDMIKGLKRQSRGGRGAKSSALLFLHGEEWFDDQPWQQLKIFLQSAGKEFVFKADGSPDIHGRTTTGSCTNPSENIREIEVVIPAAEYAKMRPGVVYTVLPRNEVPGYKWRTKGQVTITGRP
jgi:hypothetical protein